MDFLCSPLIRCFNSNLRTNIHNLEKDLDTLTVKKQDIVRQIEIEEKEGRKPTFEISAWLDQVAELENTVKLTLGENRISYCSSFFRFKLSKIVVEQWDAVNRLIASCYPPYTTDGPVEPVQQLPVDDFIENQVTASQNLNKLLYCLVDDDVGIIGMLGMGGVGKTALLANLNNELARRGTHNSPFSLVIWVNVSNNGVQNVQNQLAERLQMYKRQDESVQGIAIRLFNRLRMEKNFIIILDDVWNRVGFQEIGIPNPRDHVGSKVILTTRNKRVCREMLTDVDFLIATLNKQESWDLFSSKAGQTCQLKYINPIAEAVCEECDGLPLALNTVATAMRGNTSIELWNTALNSLKISRPEPHIQGIEEKLFLSLKLSYQALKDDNIKLCFLYCCLYPKGFSIEINELLQCWQAEGLLDGQDYEQVYRTGNALIETLKDSCLLESGYSQGTVRMHNVVRDVAVWIASSSEAGCKSIVRSGHGLLQIPITQKWDSYRRVSFMSNKIEMLPDSVLQCSQVSSLLLQGNVELKKIPSEFLQGFSSLRVLNLSNTGITSLPPAENLGDLRALFLKNCFNLKQFPPLRGHGSLQLLDLSDTRMELSSEEAALKLKDLNLPDHLLEFYVHLNSFPSITFEDSTWLRRLQRFRICICSTTDAVSVDLTLHDLTLHNERVIYLSGISSWREELLVFLSYASALILVRCQCIVEIFENWRSHSDDCSIQELSISLCDIPRLSKLLFSRNMRFLSKCHIDRCSLLSGNCLMLGDEMEENTLESLESLSLENIEGLTVLWMGVVRHPSLKNLKVLEVQWCASLKTLLVMDLINHLKKLEIIIVRECKLLEEIVQGSDGKEYDEESRNGKEYNEDNPNSTTATAINLPRLHSLILQGLPELEIISRMVWVCTSLQHVEVFGCPKLKKLPFSVHSLSNLETVKGVRDWWETLEWDNASDKSFLQPWFEHTEQLH